MSNLKINFNLLLLAIFLLAGNYLYAAEAAPLVLRTMGGMTFAGSVHIYDNGDTAHVDHGYAQYFIPQNSRNYPIVMWHGIGQSGACWETTPT